MNGIISWVKNNRSEFYILLAILIVGAFLRLFKISEYMTFLADEGRDVLIVRKLLVEGDLIFVGPGTSIGTMYLGPLYYYLMAPALFLANYSPVGPSVMVALFGVATIFLVWKVAREWFPTPPRPRETSGINFTALLVALVYATSGVAIIFARSSWNPNIMPFFALLSLYSIWKVYKEQKYVWLLVLGVSFAVVLQSHYLGLLLLPVIFIFWLLKAKDIFKNKLEKKDFLKFSVFGFLAFILLMLPLILFDFKHDFRNFRAMIEFATGSKENYSPTLEDTISKIPPMFKFVTTRMFSPKFPGVGLAISMIMLLASFFSILKNKNTEGLLILLWLGFGSLGLALLRQDVYDHYFGFLFPAPFLMLAFLIKDLNKKIVIGVGAILLLLNINSLPVLSTPNMQYPRSLEIAKKIVEESKGEKFHLATISESNNRDPFLYNLTLMNAPVVDIDPQNYDATLVDQLFVICERIASECDPTHNPSSWITNFGWSRIENSWNVWGVTIYKLVHTEEWLQNRN